MRWYQAGSIASGDLANVVVKIDGDSTSYPTTVSSDGKYYTAVFGTGLTIDKGLSKEVYIQGDIVGTGAAGRSVRFDVYKNTDINLVGETYGYGITPTPSANIYASVTAAGTNSGFIGTGSSSTFAAGTPYFKGVTVTVGAGSVTSLQKASTVPPRTLQLTFLIRFSVVTW